MHDLDRFLRAQEGVMAAVRTELRAGRKQSHWMWFVFPQLRGLGHSAMAQHYGIASLDEARAYLAHSRGCTGENAAMATQPPPEPKPPLNPQPQPPTGPMPMPEPMQRR